MKTKTINLYTLEELEKNFPAVYEKTIERLIDDEIQFWQPCGDFYFEPGQEEAEEALKIALSVNAPGVYPTYEAYRAVSESLTNFQKKIAYSPGHAFFDAPENRFVYDPVYRNGTAGCVDMRAKNEYVFLAWLGIPARYWHLISVHVAFSRRYERNFLVFESRETSFCFSDETGLAFDAGKYPRMANLLTNAIEKFDDLLREAHRRIREDFEYSTSEEHIREMARDNDWHFDEEGRMYND